MMMMIVCLMLSASRLGLYASGGRALSGEQIDQMDIGQLEKVINHICVFFRVSPRHKLKIVKVSFSSLPGNLILLLFLECCYKFWFSFSR